MHRTLATITLIAVTLVAAVAEEVEPGILKGRVVDSQGNPLQGAEIVADNTLFYNSNAIGTTGPDGRYQIDVGALRGSYNATATIKRKYNKKTYEFSLAPVQDESFDGSDGAIRDFVWKLKGEKDEEGQFHGSSVVYYHEIGSPLLEEDVMLTLEPVGPLVDGATGETIRRKGERTPDGPSVRDVPVGRYRISATHAPQGESPQSMLVRMRNTGEYVPSIEADFTQVMRGVHHITIEVKLAP